MLNINLCKVFLHLLCRHQANQSADEVLTGRPKCRHELLSTIQKRPRMSSPMRTPQAVAAPPWLRCLIDRSERLAAIPARPHLARDLQLATGLGGKALAHQLRLAGWYSQMVWGRSQAGRRVQQRYWVPAGQTAPKPPRGRPRSFATWDEIAATGLLGDDCFQII